MSTAHKAKIDGIDYSLLIAKDSGESASYDVIADGGGTAYSVFRAPDRWTLFGGGKRSEFTSLPSLFLRIAKEIHG